MQLEEPGASKYFLILRLNAFTRIQTSPRWFLVQVTKIRNNLVTECTSNERSLSIGLKRRGDFHFRERYTQIW